MSFMNNPNMRQQFAILIEELRNHPDLKVSMDYGEYKWYGYNTYTDSMYILLEMPTHLKRKYENLSIVSPPPCFDYEYVLTDHEGRQEIIATYDELMSRFCGDCLCLEWNCECDDSDDEVDHADVIVTQCQEEPKRIFH